MGNNFDAAGPIKAPIGRPTDYNQDIADRICAHIAGGQSVRSFCRKDDTPSLSAVMMWVVKHPEFMEQYRVAREAAGHSHADGIIDIVERMGAGLEPAAGRAMIDGLKWAAERNAAKVYGPRSMVDVTSGGKSLAPDAELTTEEVEKEMIARGLSIPDNA